MNTPLALCIERDVKGMYKKALAGEIKNFTGVDDPYEPPHAPELIIETASETDQQSAARILTLLEQLGLAEPAHEPPCSPEEAAKIRQRLARLGYIEP